MGALHLLESLDLLREAAGDGIVLEQGGVVSAVREANGLQIFRGDAN